MPSPRSLATALGAGRAALGAILLVAPDLVTPRWVGEAGRTDAGRALARGVGGRDIALGVGTIIGGRPWVLAGVGADVGDLLATAAAPGLPRGGRIGTGALAGGAALIGLWLAGALD